MLKRLLMLLCLALPAWAQAETIDPRIAKWDICGRYELFHINGIDTSAVGAADNLEAIILNYGNAYSGHIITYGLGYNSSRGADSDFIDSFNQIVRGYPGATFSAWVRAVTLGMYNSAMTASVAAAIAKAVDAVFSFSRPPTYGDADLFNIESEIRTRHAAGGRLLLVPHSQGNMYANLVLDRLVAVGGPRTPIARESIGIMGVATPRAVTGGLYLTSKNDRVISGVRYFFADTPAGNITIAVKSIDPLGHHFRDIYWKFAKTSVNNLISLAFSRLASSAASPVWQGSYPPTLYSQVRWWTLCSPTQPCWRYIGVPVRSERFDGPVVEWQVPNSRGHVEAQVGSLSDAINKAYENAQLCYELARDQMISARAAGYMNHWLFVPGCGQTVGHPYQGVWFAYSGDGPPVFRHTHYPQSYEVITTVGATCRQGSGT